MGKSVLAVGMKLPESRPTYELVAHLHKTRDTWYARDLRDKSEVLFKALNPADRFEGPCHGRESSSLLKIKYPRIRGVKEHGTLADGRLWLTLVWVPGHDLAALLTKVSSVGQKLNPYVVAAWLAQMADAFQACHDAGYVHRDIKPENVIVKGPGDLHLIDFGLALTLDEAGQPRDTLEGTLGYLSPEEVLLDPIDVRSDVYSFGIMLYVCLTGKMPLDGANADETMALHVQNDCPDPREIVPQIPASMAEVVCTAGQCDPDARYQSMKEVAAVLRSIKPG